MKLTDNQIEKNSRLIEIRKKLKLSQIEMAKKIDLTQSKLSEIESRKAGKDILYDIFYRVNYEFGISKEWWENGKGEMLKSEKIYDSEDLNKSIAAETLEYVSNSSEYWKGRFDQLREDYKLLLEKIEKK